MQSEKGRSDGWRRVILSVNATSSIQSSASLRSSHRAFIPLHIPPSLFVTKPFSPPAPSPSKFDARAALILPRQQGRCGTSEVAVGKIRDRRIEIHVIQ